jgi:t-SNARE complex subunit (syntaxin)
MSPRQISDPDRSPEQRQAQLLQSQLSPHELAYQESTIQEREREIEEIETGIHELAEIFHDLGTLVNQQGGMLGMLPSFLMSLGYELFNVIRKIKDNIESNIHVAAADMSGSVDELRTASEYQRKGGRRAACLMIILVVVIAVVLLAV